MSTVNQFAANILAKIKEEKEKYTDHLVSDAGSNSLYDRLLVGKIDAYKDIEYFIDIELKRLSGHAPKITQEEQES